MSEKRPSSPYQSVLDIPFYREMYQQMRAIKPLLLFSPNLRKQMKDVERKLRESVRVVDGFYELLGPRHWVFHGHLNTDNIEALLHLSPEEAEHGLIRTYNEGDWLSLWVRRIGNNPMSSWRELLDAALEDYQAERYLSSVQLVLAVMDGFVNTAERGVKIGLHAREDADMQAWNSVIGHHQGLTNVMSVFKRDVKRLVTDPIYELHRNGIVHGMMVNYGNVVVATKAWNYLFSVVDWAEDREKQQEPDPEPITWTGLFKQLRDNETEKQALEAWKPGPGNPGEAGWDDDELVNAAKNYLQLWMRKNYGGLAEYLQEPARQRLGKTAPAEIRMMYRDSPLEEAELVSIDRLAPAIAVVRMRLVSNGNEEVIDDRWVYQDEKGRSTVSGTGRGRWARVFNYCPL